MSVLDQIRDLDPNDPGRWPITFRLGAIGLIFIVSVVLLAWLLAWKPKKPELDAARAEEQALLSKLEAKAKKAANLDAYKAQLAEMEQSFGAMLRKLPNKTEVPNLLTDISQQGTAAGLDQKLFQPSPQNMKDFYAELPIKMKDLSLPGRRRAGRESAAAAGAGRPSTARHLTQPKQCHL